MTFYIYKDGRYTKEHRFSYGVAHGFDGKKDGRIFAILQCKDRELFLIQDCYDKYCFALSEQIDSENYSLITKWLRSDEILLLAIKALNNKLDFRDRENIACLALGVFLPAIINRPIPGINEGIRTNLAGTALRWNAP